MNEFSYDINEELLEIKISTFLKGLPDEGRAMLMKKMLGPLLVPRLLTSREAAFFFLEAALSKSQKAIARDFRLHESSVSRTLSTAEKKIKKHRRGH